jgi:hypothetical protein
VSEIMILLQPKGAARGVPGGGEIPMERRTHCVSAARHLMISRLGSQAYAHKHARTNRENRNDLYGTGYNGRNAGFLLH